MSNDQSSSSGTYPPGETYDEYDYEGDAYTVGETALSPVPASREPSAMARFDDDVRELRVKGGRFNLSERTLMVVGGVIAPLGLLFILLGWVGASRTPNVFEQIPYLISGGLFGLALVFLGAIFYFAHWLTELVREGRQQSAELIAAVDRLQTQLAATVERPDPVSAEPEAAPLPELVATQHGSMAHRLDCPVVAGKGSLRAVAADDDMAPCKLCEPYDA